MSDSSISRVFATDPRIANPKPVEMHTNALLFVQDAEALGRRATAGQFFLFAHGIELALKGFLHEKGRTLEELEGIGHKLGKLLDLCTTHGLVLSEGDTASIVARFDKALLKAKLRYDFDFDMPFVEDARRVARGLLNNTMPALPSLA
ncbi:hypothetical protein [Bradyrhizobium sp. HKCCYLRH3061]|uniref:hypothetical protein n=1 Tax=Bradyrhizobium sp. HKCCYLRH3061 TaxID=3420734 RepID=UPI003EBD8A71